MPDFEKTDTNGQLLDSTDNSERSVKDNRDTIKTNVDESLRVVDMQCPGRRAFDEKCKKCQRGMNS